MKKVGHRRISRYWNKDMTDEEFDDFWKGSYENDKEADKRYRETVLLKIRDEREKGEEIQ